MRRTPILGAAMLGAAALAACETPTVEPEAVPRPPPPVAGPLEVNDCDSLVPIEAEDTSQGLARELAWLEREYPGARVVNQSLTDCDGMPADRVVFAANGRTRVVLFDASSFFGVVDGDDLDALLDG